MTEVEAIRAQLERDGFQKRQVALVDGHEASCGWCGGSVNAFELWSLEMRRSPEYPPEPVDSRMILFPCLHGQDPVPDDGVVLYFHRTVTL